MLKPFKKTTGPGFNDHLPLKRVDNKYIEKLFAIIQDGDYDKIRNFVSDKNITFDVRNENGESVIHVIIKNKKSDFEEREKYNLVKYFIEHGVSVSDFDKNNITPIHLAAKYQLPSIVELLIENGANVRVIDNQGMNPLHYLTQGKMIECKQRKKVKSLIPSEAKREVPLINFKNTTACIIDIFYHSSFSKFFTHAKNTINNFKDFFPSEFEEFEKKYIDDISKIMSNNKNIKENDIKMRSKLMEFIKEINEFITKKLENSIKQLDIKPNQINGWSPNDILGIPETELEKIIPDNIKIEKIEEEYEIMKYKVFNIKFRENIDNISKIKEKINNFIDNTSKNINKIIQHNINLYFNSVSYNGGSGNRGPPIPFDRLSKIVDWNELRNYMLYPNSNKLYMLEINLRNKFDVNNFDVIEFDKEYFKYIDSVRVRKKQYERLIKMNKLVDEGPLTDDQFYRVVGRNYMSHRDYDNRFTFKNVENTSNLFFVGDYYDVAADRIMPAPAPVPAPAPALAGILIPLKDFFDQVFVVTDTNSWAEKKKYFFISKFNFYYDQIEKHLFIINHNIEAIKNHIDNNYYYEVFHGLITNTVIAIINALQYLIHLPYEIEIIKNNSREIKILFDKKLKENYADNYYAFSYEFAADAANKIYKESNNINNYLIELYETLFSVYSNLNSIIELLNMNAAKTYIKNYFGDNLSYFEDKDVKNLVNIFDRTFKKLVPLPDNIEEYRNKFEILDPNNLTNKKKELLEIFLPQISKDNYQTYYSDKNYNISVTSITSINDISLAYRVEGKLENMNNRIPTTLTTTNNNNELMAAYDGSLMEIKTPSTSNKLIPRIGYLIKNRNDQSHYDAAILGTGNAVPGPGGSLASVAQIDIQNETFAEEPLPDLVNKEGIPRKLEDAREIPPEKKYIGHIGYEYIPTNFGFDRRKAALTSLGSKIDFHLNYLRIYMIKALLISFAYYAHNKISTKKINGEPIELPNKIKHAINKIVEDIFDSFKDDYKIDSLINNYNPKMKSILYCIIGKIADNLIISLFKRSINTLSVKYVRQILHKNFENDEYFESLNKLNKKDIAPVSMFNIDTGYEVNFNTLFDELLENFYEKKSFTDMDYESLKYGRKLMQDEDSIEEQYFIHNYNYIATNQIIKQCYDIKPEIANILIQKKCDIDGQDIVQSTPIFYALETLHEVMVKTLLDNGATVYRDSIKNNIGITPYQHILNLYDQHNKYIYDNDILKNLYEPIYKKIKQNLQSKTEYKNNIIKHLDIIFPQMLIMYNNMFYMHMLNYSNEWNYDKFKKLLSLLNEYKLIEDSDIFVKKIPLIDGNNIYAINKNNNIGVMNDKIESFSDNIDDYQKMHNERIMKLYSMRQELDEIRNKGIVDTIQKNYEQTLLKKIELVNKQIENIEKNMSEIKKKKGNLEENVNVRRYEINDFINGAIENFLGTDKHAKIISPDKLYSNIFTEIVNSKFSKKNGHEDYELYNSLWKRNIDVNPSDSIMTIHILLVKLQAILIKELSYIKNNDKDTQKDILSRSMNDFNIIKELYDDIFKFIIHNMENSPEVYGKVNIFLKDVIDIIIHIVKHVIFSNFYHLILRSLAEYIKSISPKKIIEFVEDDTHLRNLFDQEIKKEKDDESLIMYNSKEKYGKYIALLINSFVQYNKNGTNKYPLLKNYIIDDLPKISVKYILDIYENDYDPDKTYNSLDSMFEKIFDIIKQNPVMSIEDDSSIITNLKDYVIPFYKDLLNEVVPKMKQLIHNYNRYILNESRYIEIMALVNDKSIKEIK